MRNDSKYGLVNYPMMIYLYTRDNCRHAGNAQDKNNKKSRTINCVHETRVAPV